MDSLVSPLHDRLHILVSAQHRHKQNGGPRPPVLWGVLVCVLFWVSFRNVGEMLGEMFGEWYTVGADRVPSQVLAVDCEVGGNDVRSERQGTKSGSSGGL